MCCRFPPHFSLKATDEKGSAPLSSVGRAAAPADAAAAATEEEEAPPTPPRAGLSHWAARWRRGGGKIERERSVGGRRKGSRG